MQNDFMWYKSQIVWSELTKAIELKIIISDVTSLCHWCNNKMK